MEVRTSEYESICFSEVYVYAHLLYVALGKNLLVTWGVGLWDIGFRESTLLFTKVLRIEIFYFVHVPHL